MKIKLQGCSTKTYWGYKSWFGHYYFTLEQFDYMYKYLDFDKLKKTILINFNNEEIKEWFSKTFINSDYLEGIYTESPEGYKWLKDNWGNGIFKITVNYSDKQEYKTIINRVINIELIRSK